MPDNIVLLVLDSVRADHCSLYGYDRDTTPNLSTLSATTFDSAYANAPYTPASVPSLLTSRYPLEDGHVVYNDYPTIAEYLSDSEYTTAAAFNNAQITRWGYDEQFDSVVNLSLSESGGDNDESSILQDTVGTIRSRLYDGIKHNKRLAAIARDTYYRFGNQPEPHPPDSVVLSEATELMDSLSEPYFLYIHLMDTHHPYVFEPGDFEQISSEPFDRNRYQRLLSRASTHVDVGEYVWDLSETQRDYVCSAYDASIRSVERQVTQFISDHSDGNTSFIVTSDHGEEFWERGHFGHGARPAKPRDMTLYDEMIHVPLLTLTPSGTESTVTDPVMLVDLLPTILDTADVSTEQPLRGTSLWNIADSSSGDDGPDSRKIISHATSPGDPKGFYDDDDSSYLGSIRADDLKLHYTSKHGYRLFDIESDPREREDIEAANPTVAGSLQEQLMETIHLADVDTTQDTLEDDVENTLKQLGYLE